MKQVSPTIFVAEDTLFYQQLIRRMLEPVRVESIFFTSGEMLLLQLPFARPEMAILDYNLEGKMTGLETLRGIRKLYPDVYVILFSTRIDLPSPENFNRYGHFDFIEKSTIGLYRLHQKVVQAFNPL